MTVSVPCGKPTPGGGACRRLVSAPGVPCGAVHPDPVAAVSADAGAVVASGPGPDPFAPVDDTWIAKVRLAEDADRPGVLARLAADPDPVVREVVAANPACPAGTLAALAADPEGGVRSAVAGNRSCPPEVALGLLSDRDLRVMTALLVDNGGVFDDVSDWHDKGGWRLEDDQPPLPAGLVTAVCAKKLPYHRYPDVLNVLAGNWHVPVDELDRLGGALHHIGPQDTRTEAWGKLMSVADSHIGNGVNLAAAGCHPEAWMTKDFLACWAVFKGDENPVGYENIFGDERLARSLIEATVAHPGYSNNSRNIEGFASHIEASETALRGLARDGNEPTRRLVASFDNCPPDVLADLAADPDPAVREIAASHPNCPPAARAHAGLLTD